MCHCNQMYYEDAALSYFDKAITYQDVLARIEDTTKALCTLDVASADIVSICLPAMPEAVYSLYAINRLGAISNWIDPRSNEESFRGYLSETSSEVVIILDLFIDKIINIIENTKVKHIIVVSVADSMPIATRIGYGLLAKRRKTRFNGSMYLSWEAFIKRGYAACDCEAPYATDAAAVILHTGGTSGVPKSVVLSNENMNAAVHQYGVGLPYERGQKLLGILPPFIAYGLITGIHMPLCHRGQAIMIPKFDAAKFDQLILKYEPNRLVGVPSYFQTLIYSPRLKGRDLSFISFLAVGGDHMDAQFETRLNAFLDEHNVKNHMTKGYAMTELCATAVTTVNDASKLPDCTGIPFHLTNIGVFEPGTDIEVMYNQLGEVCISSPTIMLEYMNGAMETNETIVVHKDGKRWVHSKDIGYITEDGMLYIVDRLKRMIIRPDGFKVYPHEIEHVICQHEAVEQCAVIGIPSKSDSHGSLPKAYIVLHKDYPLEPKQVLEHISKLCCEHLPEYAQPTAYMFLDALPLTPIGKIDYRALEREEGTSRN